jgi:hypothetical protein
MKNKKERRKSDGERQLEKRREIDKWIKEYTEKSRRKNSRNTSGG